MICDKCGKETGDAKFCGHCGNGMPEKKGFMAGMKNTRLYRICAKHRKKIIIGGIALFAIGNLLSSINVKKTYDFYGGGFGNSGRNYHSSSSWIDDSAKNESDVTEPDTMEIPEEPTPNVTETPTHTPKPTPAPTPVLKTSNKSKLDKTYVGEGYSVKYPSKFKVTSYEGTPAIEDPKTGSNLIFTVEKDVGDIDGYTKSDAENDIGMAVEHFNQTTIDGCIAYELGCNLDGLGYTEAVVIGDGTDMLLVAFTYDNDISDADYQLFVDIIDSLEMN